MRLRFKDYFLVGIQLILFALYYFDFGMLRLSFPEFIKDASLFITFLGILILFLAILQLNRNLSPFPTPKSGGKFVQNGLYKYIRHPIYTGILVCLAGYAVFSASGFRFLVCLCLYVLFSMKIVYEEKLLLKKFSEYEKYRDKTGKFFPKIFQAENQ